MLTGKMEKYQESKFQSQTEAHYLSYGENVIKKIDNEVTKAENLGIKKGVFLFEKSTGKQCKFSHFMTSPSVVWTNWNEPPNILCCDSETGKYIYLNLDEVELVNNDGC